MVHGRSQDRPINIVSKRLEDIGNEKEYLSRFVDRKYEMEENKKQLEEEIKRQQNNLEILKKRKTIEEEYHLEQEKIKIGENTIKEYQRKMDEMSIDNKENTEETRTKKAKAPVLAIIITLILIAGSLLSMMVVKNNMLTAIVMVLTILSIIYTSYQQYKRKSEYTNMKKAQNVDKDKANTQIEVMKATIKKLQDEQERLSTSTKTAYEEAIEKLKSTNIGIVPIHVIQELLTTNDLKLEIEEIENKIIQNQLKIQSIGLDQNNILPKLENLASLEEEYEGLEEQYQALTFQNEAIELAKQELEEAYHEMKKKITPSFTSNLSKIMQRLSNGAYTNIKLDEKDGLIVETKNRKLHTSRLPKHRNHRPTIPISKTRSRKSNSNRKLTNNSRRSLCLLR